MPLPHCNPALRGAERSAADLPDLCSGGHALVISAAYAGVTGSAVLMRNLLSGFRGNSYSLITYADGNADLQGIEPPAHVLRFMGAVPLAGRPIDRWRDAWHAFVVARVKRMTRRIKPDVIVAVYPHLHLFAAAREAAAAERIPWVAYFHDTLAEMHCGGRYDLWAREVQKHAFQDASAVIVTGRGMADLFARRYGMACMTLEIPYPEEFCAPDPAGELLPRALMGGMIYDVNHHATRRVAEVLKSRGCPLVLATGTSRARLKAWGIDERLAETQFFAGRREYLAALRNHRILVVTLNWPDETDVSEDELATAFPTKAVEYLASGRPVLVHCPEHYYLARFFRERRCGIVVSDPTIDALGHAIDEIIAGRCVPELTCAASEAARLFSAGRIRSEFHSTIDRVAQLSWSQKLS